MVKQGVKTLEFWTTLAVGAIAIFWPQFPKESLAAIIAWVAARSGQKAFGFVDPQTGTASYKTTEFWVAIIFAVAKAVFPDIPQDALYAVMTYVFGRAGVKALENFNVPKKG